METRLTPHYRDALLRLADDAPGLATTRARLAQQKGVAWLPTNFTDHVHYLSPDSTTDRPVLGAITGTRGTLVVDAGNSPAHAQVLLDHLAAANLAPPRYLALTHWHWDHWFGAAAVDLPTFAHVETRRILVAQAAWDWSDAALDERVAQGLEIAFCRDMFKAELPDRSGLVLRPPDAEPGVTAGYWRLGCRRC